MRRPLASLLLLATATAAAAAPPPGATVEIAVVERNGGAVDSLDLSLRPADSARLPFAVLRRLAATTGRDGTARLAGVPPGEYLVAVRPPPDLVAPEENPFAPPPRVTVLDPAETVAIRLELWRGIALVAQVKVDRGDLPEARLVFTSRDSGFHVERPIGPGIPSAALNLVPGRWSVALADLRSGHLIADAARDGTSLHGDEVQIDLDPDERLSHLLEWRLAAVARVSGRFSPPGAQTRLEATLIEPGPLWRAAEARGSTPPAQVTLPFYCPLPDRCHYDGVLPDGHWRLGPIAPVATEPDALDLDLASGSDVSQDFEVVRGPGGPGADILVCVHAPEPGPRGPLAGAVVEVWPLAAPGEALVTQGVTGEQFRCARLEAVPKEPLRVVAGHVDYVEGSIEVGASRPGVVRVDLGTGAAVVASAHDLEGQPRSAVEVSVELLEPLRPSRLSNPILLARRRLKTARTDASGRARIRGLDAGRHRLHARLAPPDASGAARLLGPDRRRVAELEVTIGDDEEVRVEVVVVPAPHLIGRLACDDREPLPPTVSVRLHAGPTDDDPVLKLDPILLRGDPAEAFTSPAVEPGTYRVSVSPTGFAGWSWAAAGEPVEVAGAGAVELGTMVIECAPRIRVVPVVRSGQPVPDLRPGSAALSARRIDDGTVHEPRPELGIGDVVFRGLPPAALEVEASVTSPFFLPGPVARAAGTVTPRRGGIVELSAPVDGIGGAIRVHGDGAFARVTGELDGAARTEATVDAVARIPSLVPGRYRTELCDDGCCTRVRASHGAVAVTAARWSEVP